MQPSPVLHYEDAFNDDSNEFLSKSFDAANDPKQETSCDKGTNEKQVEKGIQKSLLEKQDRENVSKDNHFIEEELLKHKIVLKFVEVAGVRLGSASE